MNLIKKAKQLFVVILTLSCFITTSSLQAGNTPDTKVLYIGIANSIDMTGFVDDIELKGEDCIVLKNKEGKWTVWVKGPANKEASISYFLDGKLVKKDQYQIERLPDPLFGKEE